MSLDQREVAALETDDDQQIAAVFGYPIARCPGGAGKRCLTDAEWGHPCGRDTEGVYESERVIAGELPLPTNRPFCLNCRSHIDSQGKCSCGPGDR